LLHFFKAILSPFLFYFAYYLLDIPIKTNKTALAFLPSLVREGGCGFAADGRVVGFS